MSRSIAPKDMFHVLKFGEVSSGEAHLLADMMKGCRRCDWPALLRLGRIAAALPGRVDRLYALSFYARITEAWRGGAR